MNPNSVKNRYGSAVVTLPSDTEILITRQFDAPAALVFKAWTTPELAWLVMNARSVPFRYSAPCW